MAPNPLTASATFPCTADREDVGHWESCFSVAGHNGFSVTEAAACCEGELACDGCPSRPQTPRGGPRKRAGRGRRLAGSGRA